LPNCYILNKHVAKNFLGGWAWWFKPVVLATWEVEIKRIMVGGQPGKKINETPPLPQIFIWAIWCMPVISAVESIN
jgi:hypothetical protein